MSNLVYLTTGELRTVRAMNLRDAWEAAFFVIPDLKLPTVHVAWIKPVAECGENRT